MQAPQRFPSTRRRRLRRTAHAAAVAGLAAATVLAGGATVPVKHAAAAEPVPALVWSSCGDPQHPRLECATLPVPLDYHRPRGRQITLALSRVRHTAPAYQGPLLVNLGGPGGPGTAFAAVVADALPVDVSAQYDIIGFDPRGVGNSEPSLHCQPDFFTGPQPDHIPRTAADERLLVERAHGYARACAQRHDDVLPMITTENTARDMDLIRTALGAGQINYFAYSYGTYLGAVYARLFPDRVRRMALDSVVDPDGVWYRNTLAQDGPFEARANEFFTWAARYDQQYHLGRTGQQVSQTYLATRDRLRLGPPAGGLVGPSELDVTFVTAGYKKAFWPLLANALATFVNTADPTGLVAAHQTFSLDEHTYAAFTAVFCADAHWPRNWSRWHTDTTRLATTYPLFTWGNTWFVAPCAFWAPPTGPPINVTNHDVAPVLLLQSARDPASPFPGALSMHQHLAGSRLVLDADGGDHGVTLNGNTCLDAHLTRYLTTGALPADQNGVDATCPTQPDPVPADPVTR